MTGPQFSTSEIEDWGKFQVVIGDVDKTVVNGVPIKIMNWSLREPFSDSAATFYFGGVDPFSPEDDYPFEKFDNIEINQVDKDGWFIKNLFEGMIASVDDSFSEGSSGITVQAIGALYQADYYIRPPVFNDYTFDIGSAVQFEINSRIEYYGLRLQKLPLNTYTNIGSRSRGSWNPLLTGWIQDLLGTAYTDGFMLKGEEACAIVRVEGAVGTGLWALGSFGSNLSLGPNIPYYGSASYLTYYVANLYQDFELYTRDMANRPQYDGFWILDRRGKVFCYGNATHYGDKSTSRIKAWAIESTPSGEGYWILDALGNVYEFGDAVHHGDSPALPVVNGYADATVDMCTMPDGSGYWLFTRCGKVHAYGSAVDYGEPPLYDRFWASIQPSPTGLGYYCSDTKGRVRVFGDAVFQGETSSPDSWITDIAISETGDGYALLNDNGKIVYFGDFPELGGFDWSMFDEHGANIYQWTLRKDPERRLKFAVKDNWTVNWTVHCGQPGVSHELTHDYAWAPNVYYGEGIDNNNCRWRNSKYPNIHPDDAPIWPGYLFSVHLNQTSTGVRVWQQAMKDRGWPIDVTGVFGWNDNHVAVRFQESAGLQVDGIIGPQTWAAVFNTGEDSGNLNGSYFAPIAQRAEVEPFVYGGNGSITGRNPRFDRKIVRIEHYDNYGEKIGKDEATISAQSKIRKDSGVNYAGRITFKTDPAEGHRLDIREGQNILYKGFKGADWMFHIAQVDFNPDDLTVTCTVDTAFRDAMTIAAIYQRNDPLNANPSRTRTRNQSASKIVEDKISVWDCENGAGVIPKMGIYAGLWHLIRIPAGEFGQVIQTYFRTSGPSLYSIAVFDRPTKPNDLVIFGDPNADDYWSQYGENSGLVIAWGGQGQMCGYYPGRGGQDDPITGVFVDRGSWNYWSTQSPWLWIAIYATTTTYIEGRLHPGQEGTGSIPDAVAVAEPTGMAI